jgi:hypothetical protein
MNPRQLATAARLAKENGDIPEMEKQLTHLGLLFALAHIKGNVEFQEECRRAMKGLEDGKVS